MNHLAQARNVFDIELAALKAVRAQLDGAFAQAVELIVETLRRRGRVDSLGSAPVQLFLARLAAQSGDLRIEITGASDLVVYQPADGQLAGLPATVTISLLPKGEKVDF